MMPFFSDFERKNHFSHAHILSKKRQISKKHVVLMPMFCQTKRPFSQKHAAPMSFISNFHGKSLPVMPIFGQKNVNSVKTTLYYRPKSQ